MSDDEIRAKKVELRTPEDLNLANITRPDVVNKSVDTAQKDAAQHPELTAEEKKLVEEMAKKQEAKDLLMRCPVAGKHLSQDKKEA